MSFLISNSFPRARPPPPLPPLSLYLAPYAHLCLASYTLTCPLHPVLLPSLVLLPALPYDPSLPRVIIFSLTSLRFRLSNQTGGEGRGGEGTFDSCWRGVRGSFSLPFSPLLSFVLLSSHHAVSQRIANFFRSLCRCICDGCVYRTRIA